MNLFVQMLGVLLTAMALLLCLPVIVVLLQVLLSLPSARAAATVTGRRPRIAVLVPAHDEAAGIGATLDTITPQLAPGDRLLVVADNCLDATASVAAAHGAHVVQRCDETRRGKGYALDFGVRHLEKDPPDVVVIVDADCQLGPQALTRLSQACVASARPVQALYLMHTPRGASLKARIGELAWVVKNLVRPLGAHRAGWPCPLMGTGMAFAWKHLCGAPLASGHLVEDMQLGLHLAAAGTPPLFCPDARVASTFPQNAAGLASQRARWEHGHLGLIATQAPRLLWRALVRGRPALLAMALDLAVPPLAALVLLLLGTSVLAALAAVAGAGALPLALSSAALGLLALAVLLAWRRHAHDVLSLRELLGAPLYVLAKVPLYARLFRSRQVEWVRTRRDDQPR
jgi:cellulose synthase/poly-beta-1,6-N-acetylglucosamine synthase-like glycosyltransferase